MKKNRKQQTRDILNAIKADNRRCDIENHGKPLSYASVVRNKKNYSRKQKHKLKHQKDEE